MQKVIPTPEHLETRLTTYIKARYGIAVSNLRLGYRPCEDNPNDVYVTLLFTADESIEEGLIQQIQTEMQEAINLGGL